MCFYTKTLNMALVITLFCAHRHPLAYYLRAQAENRANLLLFPSYCCS
jgi:ABC-type spermidine/putrescine transport system permease subunit I